MKALSKPLSSPGRSEKFPPPLLRFLRSNVGSRSRGRSRSSPMFYMRTRKTAQAVIGATQEPSSPKVTCIGQVRVRRAAKKTSTAATVKRRRRWWRLKKPLFCGKIRFRRRKRPFRKIFRNWCLFFRFGYCKKVDVTEDSFRVNSNQKSEITVGKNRISSSSNCSEDDCRSDKHENVVLESSSATATTPPKNALMLTRCRSAPYRSSSLGGRFWGSPLAEEESENEAGNERKTEEPEENSRCENVVEEPRISEESNKELKGTAGNNALHPLILTRCKSEPARTGERLLNPEMMQRRLDVVEPRSR